MDMALLSKTDIGLSDASIALINARCAGLWLEAMELDNETENVPVGDSMGDRLNEGKTNMENGKQFGICVNCGGVWKTGMDDCPTCHGFVLDKTPALQPYFTALAIKAGMAVLYDKGDSHWVFSPDGEFQPDGPIPDDIMYYEER